jgi:hypothetical protein
MIAASQPACHAGDFGYDPRSRLSPQRIQPDELFDRHVVAQIVEHLHGDLRSTNFDAYSVASSHRRTFGPSKR